MMHTNRELLLKMATKSGHLMVLSISCCRQFIEEMVPDSNMIVIKVAV
jgi:hypothetical protein